MKPRFFVLVLLVLILSSVATAQGLSPRQTVTDFYAYDRTHSQVVDRQTVNARRQWLSNSLSREFIKMVELTDDYLKQNPTDKPYFGDGFPFQPYEESCRAGGKDYISKYRIGSATIRSGIATVPVTISWPRQCNLKPVVYKVKLIRSRTGWRIDDLVYDDGHTLTAAMKEHRYN